MTRKHFEDLARRLRGARPMTYMTRRCKVRAKIQTVQWSSDCHLIADFCESYNPRFDRQRFLRACGLLDETK